MKLKKRAEPREVALLLSLLALGTLLLPQFGKLFGQSGTGL